MLPAAAIMLALAALYGRAAALPNVGPALHGMSAAVVGLVALAAWRLGRANLTTLFGVALAAAAFTANYWLGLSPVWVVVAAGVIGMGVEAAAAKWVT